MNPTTTPISKCMPVPPRCLRLATLTPINAITYMAKALEVRVCDSNCSRRSPPDPLAFSRAMACCKPVQPRVDMAWER